MMKVAGHANVAIAPVNARDCLNRSHVLYPVSYHTDLTITVSRSTHVNNHD